MAQTAIPLKEFDEEMKTTRRVLERVPSDKATWKPHEKSFPMGHLAQLVAGMPGWFVNVLTEPALDLASGSKYSFEKTETLLGIFDKGVADARKCLASVKDSALDESWSLKMGPKVLMSAPRGEVARQTLRHLVHHRGQMTVYLRLLDVKVPSIYGPTADEGWSG
jgi:uncharacterized damage-inducible protein DinB